MKSVKIEDIKIVREGRIVCPYCEKAIFVSEKEFQTGVVFCHCRESFKIKGGL